MKLKSLALAATLIVVSTKSFAQMPIQETTQIRSQLSTVDSHLNQISVGLTQLNSLAQNPARYSKVNRSKIGDASIAYALTVAKLAKINAELIQANTELARASSDLSAEYQKAMAPLLYNCKTSFSPHYNANVKHSETVTHSADFSTVHYTVDYGSGSKLPMNFKLISDLNASPVVYHDAKNSQYLSISIDADGKNLIQQYNSSGGGSQDAPRLCSAQ